MRLPTVILGIVLSGCAASELQPSFSDVATSSGMTNSTIQLVVDCTVQHEAVDLRGFDLEFNERLCSEAEKQARAFLLTKGYPSIENIVTTEMSVGASYSEAKSLPPVFSAAHIGRTSPVKYELPMVARATIPYEASAFPGYSYEILRSQAYGDRTYETYYRKRNPYNARQNWFASPTETYKFCIDLPTFEIKKPKIRGSSLAFDTPTLAVFIQGGVQIRDPKHFNEKARNASYSGIVSKDGVNVDEIKNWKGLEMALASNLVLLDESDNVIWHTKSCTGGYPIGDLDARSLIGEMAGKWR